MKSLFLATAAVAALSAAPALAQEPVGHVGVTYSNNEIEIGDASADGDSYAVEGSVAFRATDMLGVQFDGGYNKVEVDGGDDVDSFNGVGHLFTRNASYGFGGFAGVVDYDGATFAAGGIEGVKYFDQITVAGGAGYGQIDVDGFGEADVLGANAEARYFVTDNFRLNGGLGLSQIELDDADLDVFSASVGGEYQFASLPLSAFAKYEYNDLGEINDGFDSYDISANVISVGLRFTFGGSLRERDRSGPAFTGLNAFGGVSSSVNALVAVAADVQ